MCVCDRDTCNRKMAVQSPSQQTRTRRRIVVWPSVVTIITLLLLLQTSSTNSKVLGGRRTRGLRTPSVDHHDHHHHHHDHDHRYYYFIANTINTSGRSLKEKKEKSTDEPTEEPTQEPTQEEIETNVILAAELQPNEGLDENVVVAVDKDAKEELDEDLVEDDAAVAVVTGKDDKEEDKDTDEEDALNADDESEKDAAKEDELFGDVSATVVPTDSLTAGSNNSSSNNNNNSDTIGGNTNGELAPPPSLAPMFKNTVSPTIIAGPSVSVEASTPLEESDAVAAEENEGSAPESLPDNAETPTTTSSSNTANNIGSYSVTLEPFYYKVTMKGDISSISNVGFMEVFVGYMETNMEQDSDSFDYITYALSLFSQTTDLLQQQQQNDARANELTTTNATVHIHHMRSVFNKQLTDYEAVIIDYMIMLLEDPAKLQQYIDSQPNIDATIHAVELEFEPDGTSSNPNQQEEHQQTTNEQAKQESDDEGTNVALIAGVTVGCFVALVWMVFLWGIQSRATQ